MLHTQASARHVKAAKDQLHAKENGEHNYGNAGREQHHRARAQSKNAVEHE